MNNLANEYELEACAAARAAGAVLRRRFRDPALRVETKGLHDFVTEVDREAEQAVIEHLRRRFPDHVIMSEEGSPQAQPGAFRWVIDPLDGTTNFIHGVTPFAVSIALEDESGLLAAAVLDPFQDEMFHASRNGGARLNGAVLDCSADVAADQTLIATGFPFRELTRLEEYINAFREFVRTTAGIRRAGSAAIDLVYTACGRYDGFWEVGLSRWDIAAGGLIVREAGGRVSDVHGDDDWLASGDIVAAGPAVHARMLEITRQAFGTGRQA